MTSDREHFGLRTAIPWSVAVALLACFPVTDLHADDVIVPSAGEPEAEEQVALRKPAKLPAPFGAKRLNPKYDIWLDVKHKQVILHGEVCLDRGLLEMFACTRASKEHESVVTLDTKAFMAHAALLRLGAKPGGPALFHPEYKPAHGTEIEIIIEWVDADGKKHKARAQDWVRDISTKKAMKHTWVFAGSQFWTDEVTGHKHYSAEGGDFICVSNFPSAMLDLNVESTQSNTRLLFEAFTERIPPMGTRVRVILKPKLRDKKPSNKPKQRGGEKAAEDASSKPAQPEAK